MTVRHLVADLGRAALIAIPFVLPGAPAPRSVDSRLVNAQPSAGLTIASASDARRGTEALL